MALVAVVLAWRGGAFDKTEVAVDDPHINLTPPSSWPWPVPTSCAHALVQGRRRRQEDTAACVNLLPSLRGALRLRGCSLGSELRFAGVYDGHDGTEASMLASTRLHALVAEKLRRGSGGTGAGAGSACGKDGELLDATVQRALRDAVLALDAEFSNSSSATINSEDEGGGTTVVGVWVYFSA